jgi:hypothetical protein
LIEFFRLIPTEFVTGFNERQRIRNLIGQQELVVTCVNEDHFAPANHPIRSNRDTSALIIGENISPMWTITSPNFMEVITKRHVIIVHICQVLVIQVNQWENVFWCAGRLVPVPHSLTSFASQIVTS